MKKAILSIITILFTFSCANAQYINYKDDSGWNFGINMGGTWQPKEPSYSLNDTVFSKSYAGFSGGLTLGKAIYEKEGKFFSFDLRFRYLGGKNYGWIALADSFANPNIMPGSADSVYAYHNYKMKLNEFDLEGVLTLNSLREKTGIILYGFGGIGLNYYSVNRDVLDNSASIFNDDTPYDYSSINTSAGHQQIATDLRNLSDLDFESEVLAPELTFMPSLGLGLGYQFTDKFSMGIEHKITYALNKDISYLPTNGPNDIYHYTALSFKWNLFNGGGSSSSVTSGGNYSTESTVINPSPNNGSYSTNQTVVTNESQTVTTGNRPLVNIINPANSNMLVHNSEFHMNAKVYYVSSKNQITVKHNGFIISDFNYDVNSKLLRANLSLAPGKNYIEVVATNNVGTDRDDKEIVYEMPVITEIPPVVVINQPYSSPHYTNASELLVSAKVLNIESANQITFYVNGLKHYNFVYNPVNDVFSSSIILDEGQNMIEVRAVNNEGQAIDSKLINYIKIIPPVVTIETPSLAMKSTNNQLLDVKGSVLNVTSKSQITIAHNGYNVSNFKYNITTKQFSFSAVLILGQNVIKVKAVNDAGSDFESRKIIYNVPEQTLPPDVIFEQPFNSPTTISNSNVTVLAKVLNVNSKSQINVNFNGFSTSNFSFNAITNSLSINLNLINGNNLVKITGTNPAGSDSEETIIRFEVPVIEEPPIISYSIPSSNPFNTANNSINITGEILNVGLSNGASATLNNNTISNFTFDPATHYFSCNVSLTEGANYFEVDAFNNAGTSSKSTVIIYTPAECFVPEISLLSPSSANYSTDNSKGYLEMIISNEDQFIFKVNDEQVPSYDFDQNTGKFMSFLNLEIGVNTYELIATNECGSTSQKVNIIYEPEIPCENPVINLISPRESALNNTANTSTLSLRANVLGVTNGSNISVSLNGSLIGANFNTQAAELMANLSLKIGQNKILISAKNNCGTTQKEIIIELIEPIPSPTVVITQPNKLPFNTQDASTVVLAKVNHISNENDIHVSLDGQHINFTYSANNGLVTVPTALQMGGNNLIIEVENESGFDKATAELIRSGTPPKIHFTNRSETTTFRNPEVIVVNSRISIKGYVSNYDGATLNVIMNGTAVNFSYNPSNGIFSGSINMINNEVVKLTFSALNQWGKGMKDLYLIQNIPGSGTGNNSGGNNGNSHNGNNPPNPSGSNLIKNPPINSGSNKSGNTPPKTNTTKSELQKNIEKGDIYFNAKRWSVSKSYYEKAVRLDRNNEHAKNRISELNVKLRKPTSSKPPASSRPNTQPKPQTKPKPRPQPKPQTKPKNPNTTPKIKGK